MNDNRFLQKFKNYSSSQLEQIINDKETYVEDARVAAIELLKKKSGTTAEIEKHEIEIQTSQERKSEVQQKIDKEHKTDYSTNDLNAPQLYSKRVVMLFSAIFSTIFGAVLMMNNFKEVGNKKAQFQVLAFGVGYTILTIVIVNMLNIQTNIAIGLNWGGAAIITEYFWNKKLGKTFQYRTKNWIIPAIISASITVPIIWATIYSI